MKIFVKALFIAASIAALANFAAYAEDAKVGEKKEGCCDCATDAAVKGATEINSSSAQVKGSKAGSAESKADEKAK